MKYFENARLIVFQNLLYLKKNLEYSQVYTWLFFIFSSNRNPILIMLNRFAFKQKLLFFLFINIIHYVSNIHRALHVDESLIKKDIKLCIEITKRNIISK